MLVIMVLGFPKNKMRITDFIEMFLVNSWMDFVDSAKFSS